MDKYADESIDTATGASAPPELSMNRVRDIFASIADRYEVFNAVSSMGAYRLWINKMMSLARVAPTSSVIDIAGGTGDISFAIAKRKQPAVVVCTDLVPEMLEVAKRHYASGDAHGTPMHFQAANAQDLPYDDDTFDVATMAYGLRNMPERKVALQEILRVLRPGGQLVCLDFSTPQNPLWNAAYNVYLTRMIPFWGKLITGDDSGFVYLSRSIKAFPDQEGVAKLMEDAGFVDVEWHDCTGGIACIHVAYKPGEGAELSPAEEKGARGGATHDPSSGKVSHPVQRFVDAAAELASPFQGSLKQSSQDRIDGSLDLLDESPKSGSHATFESASHKQTGPI